MDIKINNTSFPNIEYVAIPKADGSGMALFRNIAFSQDINGVIINYNNTSIEYVPSSISGDTLVIPNEHTLIEVECEKSLSRDKTLIMS